MTEALLRELEKRAVDRRVAKKHWLAADTAFRRQVAKAYADGYSVHEIAEVANVGRVAIMQMLSHKDT